MEPLVYGRKQSKRKARKIDKREFLSADWIFVKKLEEQVSEPPCSQHASLQELFYQRYLGWIFFFRVHINNGPCLRLFSSVTVTVPILC